MYNNYLWIIIPVYFSSFSGNLAVYVKTQNEAGEHTNDQFSLVLSLSSHTTFGILCENGKKAIA